MEPQLFQKDALGHPVRRSHNVESLWRFGHPFLRMRIRSTGWPCAHASSEHGGGWPGMLSLAVPHGRHAHRKRRPGLLCMHRVQCTTASMLIVLHKSKHVHIPSWQILGKVWCMLRVHSPISAVYYCTLVRLFGWLVCGAGGTCVLFDVVRSRVRSVVCVVCVMCVVGR